MHVVTLSKKHFGNPLYSHGWEEQQPVLAVCEEGGIFAATKKMRKCYFKKTFWAEEFRSVMEHEALGSREGKRGQEGGQYGDCSSVSTPRTQQPGS